ncbi:MAG: 4-oxalomesaconate tautomerase [Francisellaceae bacterium]|jgi:4-oxalomesaconate tautomerase
MKFTFNNGVLYVPVTYMRGGTSTGIMLLEENLPKDQQLKEELLRHIMGSPLFGEIKQNKQITGLGRGYPTSNKCFIIKKSNKIGINLESTLAQLSHNKSDIDWRVNCGNMSSAIPLYALEQGLICERSEDVTIYNTNTDTIMECKLNYDTQSQLTKINIAGVMGLYPGVRLSLQNPVGVKTGKLLPSGEALQTINGVRVSCLDVSVPMVILSADDLGVSVADMSKRYLDDEVFKKHFLKIWVEAAETMNIRDKQGDLIKAEDLANSETMPKVCVVSKPNDENSHIQVQYFTPQSAHVSLAVSGGSCLAVACLTPGTIAYECAQRTPELSDETKVHCVKIRHPAGVMNAYVEASLSNGEVCINTASYERSAQTLLDGQCPIYQASDELLSAYL